MCPWWTSPPRPASPLPLPTQGTRRAGAPVTNYAGDHLPPFGRNVEDVTPEDGRLWLSRWDRRLKTKANYHGLLFGVFAWAVEEHALITNSLRQDRSFTAHHQGGAARADLAHRDRVQDLKNTFLAEDSRDLLRVMVGTGLRFGEITALRVEDIDLTKRTLTVRKAWTAKARRTDPDPQVAYQADQRQA